jgi:O-antigen/teichoic acid export membrane protein
MQSIKHKTFQGVAWSSIERFSTQGVQFIIQIIIARLLLPTDYGVIAMLTIFLAISQTFIDSGFSLALVQKSDRSEIDYATVFYFNLITGFFFFLVLFLSAPLIADFYNTPILVPVTRAISFSLIISALSVVPRAKLTINIDFKTQAKASIAGVIISGGIGIWMAYSGYGVWTLVVQSLLNVGVTTLLLWILSKWFPLRVFSIKSFKRLFFYGFKLLLSGLLDTVYRNLSAVVIGKKFTAQELGFYSRSDQFAQFPSVNISGVIGRVFFPIMCEIQDDNSRLRSVYIKFLKISVYIIFPLMFGLAALAEPLIKVVLTEKWMPSVIFLQVLCFSYIWYPIHGINLTLLQAKGRSDLFLRLEVIKKIIGIVILVITIPFGILAICIGMVISSILSLVVNTYYTKQIIGLGFFKQMRSILPSLILSSTMGGIVFLLTKVGMPDILTLAIGFLVGVLYFVGVSYFTQMEEWKELQILIYPYISRFFKRKRGNKSTNE